MNTKMKVKEFEAALHLPQKLNQIIKDGKEIPQTLPPRSVKYAYPVDSYPACPDSWMNGSEIAGSYFVGVEEDKGMWLDFNPCCHLDREVAIVVSIQGVNPITGQKTDALRLEQYKKKCPIHDVDFQQNNYCTECDFDWPDQNYLATTGTPLGNLWLDGFRRPDGTVRQYIFTAEEMKGIASQIIGKDKVYAIGVAFYYSKEEKPKQIGLSDTRGCGSSAINYHKYLPEITDMVFGGSDTLMGDCSDIIIGGDVSDDYPMDDDCLDFCEDFSGGHAGDITSSVSYGPSGSASGGEMKGFASATGGKGLSGRKGILRSQSIGGIVTPESATGQVANKVTRKQAVKTVRPVKKLEIGAGALIKQKVYRDTRGMDFWEEEPAGMMYINYCDMETLNQILEAGEIKKKSEGFMDGLTVGS